MIDNIGQMPRVRRISEKRKKRGWTQEQLAQISGLAVRTIQRIEKKDPDPASLATLQALAAAFDCRVEDIMDEETQLDEPTITSKSAEVKVKKEPKIFQLTRLATGKDLLDIVGYADMFQQDYDEPQNQQEADAISSFLQNAQDYGDLWGDLEAGQRVQCAFDCNELIKEIESIGFLVFGIRRRILWISKIDPEKKIPMIAASISIKRATNPKIIKKDGIEILPSIFEDG